MPNRIYTLYPDKEPRFWERYHASTRVEGRQEKWRTEPGDLNVYVNIYLRRSLFRARSIPHLMCGSYGNMGTGQQLDTRRTSYYTEK